MTEIPRPADPRNTAFRYRCRCGRKDTLKVLSNEVVCGCGAAYPLTRQGAIVFTTDLTEQTAYFDKLYKSGKHHAIDEQRNEAMRTYDKSAAVAASYLARCGVALDESGLSDAAVLDLACGSGWVTAGLMAHPRIFHCRFHACDISPHGLDMLGAFQQMQRSSNTLEMSVQDAENMVFDDATFDYVIGSSVLHHFNDVPAFLASCRRIMKPGGAAIFGEPFAVGYALGAAALMLAQQRTGTSYLKVDELYADLKLRITGSQHAVRALVDKHLFFQSEFADTAKAAGFQSVEYHALASREFYRNNFITELLSERSIEDRSFAAVATGIYRVMFDLFDAPTYAHSASAFNQIILRA